MTTSQEAGREATGPMTFDSLSKLEAYLVRERFRGYDPYDTLMSPVL
jgi:hypothetical protein